MNVVVLVVEEGLYSEAQLKATGAIEVPAEVLAEASYMDMYMEKAIQRDDTIDAEFEREQQACREDDDDPKAEMRFRKENAWRNKVRKSLPLWMRRRR